ncbi:hypothetical protein ABYF34_08585 [Buchananella felis]|uniref:hypothetical protein n=1 Tax=Buchananella felis TaxID=3231492 RepID=UPI003528FDE4
MSKPFNPNGPLWDIALDDLPKIVAFWLLGAKRSGDSLEFRTPIQALHYAIALALPPVHLAYDTLTTGSLNLTSPTTIWITYFSVLTVFWIRTNIWTTKTIEPLLRELGKSITSRGIRNYVGFARSTTSKKWQITWYISFVTSLNAILFISERLNGATEKLGISCLSYIALSFCAIHVAGGGWLAFAAIRLVPDIIKDGGLQLLPYMPAHSLEIQISTQSYHRIIYRGCLGAIALSVPIYKWWQVQPYAPNIITSTLLLGAVVFTLLLSAAIRPGLAWNKAIKWEQNRSICSLLATLPEKPANIDGSEKEKALISLMEMTSRNGGNILAKELLLAIFPSLLGGFLPSIAVELFRTLQ